MSRLSGFMVEETANFGAILDGDEATLSVTAPGAKLGDFAFASSSISLNDLTMTVNIVQDDLARILLANNTGGTVDLGTGVFRVKVVPYDAI